VFARFSSWLCAPQCHLDDFAVRFPFGAHQSVSVDIHCGRDLRVAHQLLLHPYRSPGVVQPRTVGVPERMPTDAGVLPGSIPALFVERETPAVRRRAVGQTPDARSRTALRARHQAASSRTDIVLLDRGRVVVPPCGRAGKDQLRPRQWGCSIGQGLPGLFVRLALPIQKNRSKVGIFPVSPKSNPLEELRQRIFDDSALFVE